MDICCTCATPLASLRHYDDREKPLPPTDQTQPCCGRVVCGKCISTNIRFTTYCPYCQLPTDGSSTLQPRPSAPPEYTALPSSGRKTIHEPSAAPPPYHPRTGEKPSDYPEKQSLHVADATVPQDTLHFLDHAHDTVTALGLRYNVPADALRAHNNIASDHLLQARRTILIPAAYYAAGVSLSPRPVEGEEEERRKGRIRRFMATCKVADYDVALLYLEQADYDFDVAVLAFREDEAWEKSHPLETRRAGKAHATKGSGSKVTGPSRFWKQWTVGRG